MGLFEFEEVGAGGQGSGLTVNRQFAATVFNIEIAHRQLTNSVERSKRLILNPPMLKRSGE